MAIKKDLYIKLNPKDLKNGLTAFFHAKNVNDHGAWNSRARTLNSTKSDSITITFDPEHCPYTSVIYKDANNLKYVVPIVNETVTIPTSINFNDVQLYVENVAKLYTFDGSNPIINFGFDQTSYSVNATSTAISTSNFYPELDYRNPHMSYPHYQIDSSTHGKNPISAWADYFTNPEGGSYLWSGSRDNTKIDPAGKYEYWGFLTTNRPDDDIIYDPYKDLIEDKNPYYRLGIEYNSSSRQLTIKKYKPELSSTTINLSNVFDYLLSPSWNGTKGVNGICHFFTGNLRWKEDTTATISVTLEKPYISLITVNPGSYISWESSQWVNTSDYKLFPDLKDSYSGHFWDEDNSSVTNTKLSNGVTWPKSSSVISPPCGSTWCYTIDLRKYPCVWFSAIELKMGIPITAGYSSLEFLNYVVSFRNYRQGIASPSEPIDQTGHLRVDQIPYFTTLSGRNMIKVSSTITSYESAETIKYQQDGVWETQVDEANSNCSLGFGTNGFRTGTTPRTVYTYRTLYSAADTQNLGYRVQIPSFYTIFNHHNDFAPLKLNNDIPVQAFRSNTQWGAFGIVTRQCYFVLPWLAITRKGNMDFNLPGFGDFILNEQSSEIRPQGYIITDSTLGIKSSVYWYRILHNYYFDVPCGSSWNEGLEYTFNIRTFQENMNNMDVISSSSNLIAKRNTDGAFGNRYGEIGATSQHRQRGIGIPFMYVGNANDKIPLEHLEYITPMIYGPAKPVYSGSSIAGYQIDENDFYVMSPYAWCKVSDGVYGVVSPRLFPNANSIWTKQYFSYINNPNSYAYIAKYGYPYKVEIYNGSPSAPGACGIIGPVA